MAPGHRFPVLAQPLQEKRNASTASLRGSRSAASIIEGRTAAQRAPEQTDQVFGKHRKQAFRVAANGSTAATIVPALGNFAVLDAARPAPPPPQYSNSLGAD
jgi:hypothetical protein